MIYHSAHYFVGLNQVSVCIHFKALLSENVYHRRMTEIYRNAWKASIM